MKEIKESTPAVGAARVILIMGMMAVVMFAPIAFGEGGDLVMKVTTILIAVATPVLAWLAARRAKRDGDTIGMKR